MLLLGLLALSATMLPASPPDDSRVVNWTRDIERHAKALWKGKRVKPGIDIGHRAVWDWVVVQQTPDGWRVLSLEDQSWDGQERTRTWAHGTNTVKVGYVYQTHRRGVWAPWHESWLVNVSETEPWTNVRIENPALCAAARTAAADQLRRRGAVFADSVEQGRGHGARILWGRVAWNMGTLACFVGLVHSVWTWKRFRGQRRWERGECPVCGYPVLAVGVVGGSRTCPECGTAARACHSGMVPGSASVG